MKNPPYPSFHYYAMYSRHRRLEAAILILFAIMCAFDSQARLYRSISFSTNDTISPVSYDGGKWQYIAEGDSVFPMTYHYDMVGNTNGEGTNVALPDLSANHFKSAPYAMHFLANPNYSGTSPGEKMFINVCDGVDDVFAVGEGGTSAEKFWVYIPSNTTPGGGLLNEWWNGALDVGIRLVDQTNAWCATIQTTNGSVDYGCYRLSTGWHKFVIQVTLAFHSPTGSLSIWCDNTNFASPSFHTNRVLTGTPGSIPCYVEAGLYRGAESYTSQIWMDDIKYGDTFADVNPDTGPGLPNTNAPSVNEAWYGSGTDSAFTNVENWSGTAPRSSGDNVYFGGIGHLSPTNNMPDDYYSFNGITFYPFTDSGQSPKLSFKVGGNRIKIAGGITNLCSAFPEVINNALSLQSNIYLDVVSSGVLTNSGVISGSHSINMASDTDGKLVLTGQNTFTGPVLFTTGILEVSAIGNAGLAGPLGAAPAGVGINAPIQTANASYSKTLRYVGRGETNNRSLYLMLNVGAANRVILDASGTGPLVFNSGTNILALVNQGNCNGQLMLTGTNRADNTLAGDVLEANNNALGLQKNGSGTWQLRGTKHFSGGVQVAGGTLKFDSISNAAVSCALGEATSLFQAGTSLPVAYAICLTNGGELQYVGTAANASDRTIALSGDGAISDGVAGGSLALNGVITNLNTNGNILTLAGSGNSAIAGHIVDDFGGLSIIKTGAGTWTLSGASSYTGDTRVSNGTLCVSSTSSGTGNMIVGGGAKLTVMVSGTSQLTPSNLTLGGSTGATNEFDGVNSLSIAPIRSGNLILTGHNTINLVGGSFVPGNTYPLISFNSISGTGSVTLGTQLSGVNATIVTNVSSIALQVAGLFSTNQFTLRVTSVRGVSMPAGITTNVYGTLIYASVGSPIFNGTTQYLATGWTGSGSVINGIGTNVSFSITNNSTLTWMWQTNVWANLNVIGH